MTNDDGIGWDIYGIWRRFSGKQVYCEISNTTTDFLCFLVQYLMKYTSRAQCSQSFTDYQKWQKLSNEYCNDAPTFPPAVRALSLPC